MRREPKPFAAFVCLEWRHSCHPKRWTRRTVSKP